MLVRDGHRIWVEYGSRWGGERKWGEWNKWENLCERWQTERRQPGEGIQSSSARKLRTKREGTTSELWGISHAGPPPSFTPQSRYHSICSLITICQLQQRNECVLWHLLAQRLSGGWISVWQDMHSHPQCWEPVSPFEIKGCSYFQRRRCFQPLIISFFSDSCATASSVFHRLMSKSTDRSRSTLLQIPAERTEKMLPLVLSPKEYLYEVAEVTIKRAAGLSTEKSSADTTCMNTTSSSSSFPLQLLNGRFELDGQSLSVKRLNLSTNQVPSNSK